MFCTRTTLIKEFKWASDGRSPTLKPVRGGPPRSAKATKGRYTQGEELEAETPGSAKPPLSNDPSAGSPTERLLSLVENPQASQRHLGTDYI